MFITPPAASIASRRSSHSRGRVGDSTISAPRVVPSRNPTSDRRRRRTTMEVLPPVVFRGGWQRSSPTLASTRRSRSQYCHRHRLCTTMPRPRCRRRRRCPGRSIAIAPLVNGNPSLVLLLRSSSTPPRRRRRRICPRDGTSSPPRRMLRRTPIGWDDTPSTIFRP